VNRGVIIRIIFFSGYFLFLIVSFMVGFNPGKEMGQNFLSFSVDMLKILPGAFILIGLFEVWVKKETIEKHFGEKSGARGYIGAILLSATTVGGLLMALPVAYSLYSKGARLSVIFTYLGAAAICRIPMAIFEASFLGIKFTAIRWLVSLPLVVITSMLLGNYLTKRNYKIIAGE
jgi:uncharacterized membrane protein YraQ (UPF0718 family)